jgi:hypothetical protein
MSAPAHYVVVVSSDNGDPEVWGPFAAMQAAEVARDRLRAKYWGDDFIDSVTAIDVEPLRAFTFPAVDKRV